MTVCLRAIFACGFIVCAAACTPEDEGRDHNPCGDLRCHDDETADRCPLDCVDVESLDVDLDACSGQRTAGEIAEATAIGMRFLQSLDLALSAGELAFELAGEANGALVDLGLNPGADALDGPFEHDGGNYHTPLPSFGESSVDVRFHFGADYEAGKKGDLIVPTLFRSESYVVGAVVDRGNGDAEVNWTETGPLVELLGFGVEPPNPFTLGLFDADLEIAKQEVRASTALRQTFSDGVRIETNFAFARQVSEPETAAFPLSVESFTVAREHTGQTLTITLWALKLAGTRPTFFGRVDFAVSGPMPFVGTALYQRAARPSVRLACTSGPS